MREATCPDCGSAATVAVLANRDGGGTELRLLCRDCERRGAQQARDGLRPIAQSLARLLLYGGSLLALLAATADSLGISGRTGFGWRQIVGAELGFLAVVLGLFLRKELLATAGAFLLLLSIAADQLKVGGVPGLGWRSCTGLLCALAMIAAGCAWQRSLARGSGAFRHWPSGRTTQH
jgi:hypothetical protein